MKQTIILTKTSIVSVIYRDVRMLSVDGQILDRHDIIRAVCSDFDKYRDIRVIPMGFIITERNFPIFKNLDYDKLIDYFVSYYTSNYQKLPL